MLLFAFFVLLIALMPWNSSLWLDETISYWVIKEGPVPLFSRAVGFQGQSPLYYYLLWAWSRLFGISEPALRALSGAFFLLSCVALVRFTRRLADAVAVAPTLLVFSISEFMLVAFVSVRPYALAICLSLWSLLFLDEWILNRSRLRAAAYVVLSVLVFYAHYLFALSFLLHPGVLFCRRRGAEWKSTGFLWLLIAAGCVPGLFQLATLASRSSELSFALVPSVLDLGRVLLPPPVAVVLLFSLMLSRVLTQFPFRPSIDEQARRTLQFAAVWWLVPAMIFFAMSRFGPLSFFVPRYFLWYTGGLALTAGVIFGGLSKVGAKFLVPSLAVISFIYLGQLQWQIEDWRGATKIACAKSDSTIFFYSGLIESSLIGWIEDPGKKEYLSAPMEYYRCKNPITLLSPDTVSPAGLGYMKAILADKKLRNEPVFLLSRRQRTQNREFPAEFIREFEREGYSVEKEWEFGTVELVRLKGRQDLS